MTYLLFEYKINGGRFVEFRSPYGHGKQFRLFDLLVMLPHALNL